MNGFDSLFTHAANWSAQALLLAIDATAGAALLAAVVLLINACCRRWISARQMGLLWGLVLLRLVLPIVPDSSFSLQRLAASVERRAVTPVDVQYDPSVGYYEASGLEAYSADPAPGVAGPATPQVAAPVDRLAFIKDRLDVLLPFVWLLGAICTLLTTAIVQWRFCRRSNDVSASNDIRLCRLWSTCCQFAGVRRPIPILLTDSIDQPAVTGIVRPMLLLPEHVTDLEDEQLRMIMLHELAHVCRWHVAANWVLLLVRAVHWWNPVYWLAAARFRSLREQACDAFAIARIEGCPTRRYGELLLMLAGRRPSPGAWRVFMPASIVGFLTAFFRKRAILNRLKALRAAAAKRNRWQSAAVGGLIALTAACGLTDAGTAEAPPQRSFDWLPRSVDGWNNWQAVPETAPQELASRRYDVERVLRRIADDERTSYAVARRMLVSLLEPDLTADPSVPNVQPVVDRRIAVYGRTLEIDAPVGVHAKIARNLRAWEENGIGQVCVETRFFTDSRDIASALGVSWRYLEARADEPDEAFSSEGKSGVPDVRAKAAVIDYLPITVTNLDAPQANQLINAAQYSKTTNLLQSPKITLFNGQRGCVFDRTQTPFVVGLQNVGKGVQRPKIEVIDEGIKLTLRATQYGDGSKVRLEGRVELGEIEEVRTLATFVGGEPGAIQLPRVRRCRIDVASDLLDGQSLLIGCIPTYEQKRFFYVLLTVRSLRGI